MKQVLATFAALTLGNTLYAHEFLNFDELSDAFGYDFATVEVEAQTVAPGLHVLIGIGGNVMVSVGTQGVLMVDSQFAPMIPKLKSSINELGGSDIDFAINTHWHFDHADGNPLLGRDGTWLIAHSNSRRMMVGEHDIDLVSFLYRQPPYPADALPVMTYQDEMQLHFNGNTIDLLHFGPAHTTGDTAVLFREKNTVHMGDVFNGAGYPFIDAGNGGDLNGMIHFCKKVLSRLDANSIVVPGHGPVQSTDDLKAYVEMLEAGRNRINGMIDAGMSVEEVIEAGPMSDFDERYGDAQRFVNRAYTSLSR